MILDYRRASNSDLDICADIRGATRDNSIDKATLIQFGVTTELWSPKMEKGTYIGVVAEDKGEVIAYCYGNTETGEVLVLAVLPYYEGYGVGEKLLLMVVECLFSQGLTELWLAAGASSSIRSYGFYRHIGWSPTGELDDNGDEILRYKKTYQKNEQGQLA
jgi:ribosomal protein S18 acetylase RimI-like enzyme